MKEKAEEENNSTEAKWFEVSVMEMQKESKH